MIGHLIDFFAKRIEEKRHFVPKITLRIHEKMRQRGEEPKEIQRGLSKEQEITLLNALSETLSYYLDYQDTITLYADYEPQGILREVAEKANLSATDFVWYTMLPFKLNIYVTKNSLVISDNGEIVLEIKE